MNTTEKRAQIYLENRNIIVKKTHKHFYPDFITENGKRYYEVKKIFKIRNNNEGFQWRQIITFSKGQLENFPMNTTILVFENFSLYPLYTIAWKRLKNKKRFQRLTIQYYTKHYYPKLKGDVKHEL